VEFATYCIIQLQLHGGTYETETLIYWDLRVRHGAYTQGLDQLVVAEKLVTRNSQQLHGTYRLSYPSLF